MHWLLIGHYGGHNTGDEAMLQGLLEAAPAGPGFRYTVVTRDGERPRIASDVPVESRPAAVWPVIQALMAADGVVLGGGTHFHDDYRGLRAVRHLRYMLRIVAISALARLLRKRVLWLGMGFGPFNRWPATCLTRIGLSFCHGITTREEASFAEVRDWVPAGRLVRSFDLAALLAEDGVVRDAPALEGSRTLAVSVTEAPDSLSWDPVRSRELWRDLSEALGRLLSRHPDVAVRIYVFRGGSREADESLSRAIHSDLQGTAPGRVSLFEYQEDPRVMLEDMAGCHAAVVARFHAAVFAYLTDLPSVFLAYHRKLRDLASEVGKESTTSVIGLRDDLGVDELYERLLGALQGEDAYQARLPLNTAVERARKSVLLLGRGAPESVLQQRKSSLSPESAA